MKKQKRKFILFVIIVLVLMIFLIFNKKNLNNRFQDELIFFKLFSSGESKENENTLLSQNQTYIFDVSYKNIDFKNIYLADTINRKTLVREKIAPGTEGEFEILLQTNQKVNYRIEFKSTNEKPKNLYFGIEGKDRKYIRIRRYGGRIKRRNNRK